MEKQIVQKVKQFWQTWDIRGFMLTSLLIQALLTFLAPYRKTCAGGLFKFIMWLLYLSADAVALFTIGLISNSQGDSTQVEDLQAFWAPFLLLHLGGPDTITALALEDNELWHRHALQLATQVATTLYVFCLSFGRNTNHLWLPSLFMFINGFTKYAERTCGLYFASVDVIRDSLSEPAAPNYNEMVAEYHSAQAANLPCRFEVKYGPSVQNNDHLVEVNGELSVSSSSPQSQWNPVKETDQMIGFAYQFYVKSKGLLADAFLSLKDDGEIRQFFMNKPAEEAFRILETELNLIYDVLHTKVVLTNKKLIYFRVISFVSVIASLLLFSIWDKSDYNHTDVVITFALLGGAILLDVATLIMLVLSDWCIILISQHDTPKLLKSCLNRLLIWSRCARNPYTNRWCESIAHYNLLKCSLIDHPSFLKIIPVKKIKNIFIDWLYIETKALDKSTLKFIIEELQQKAKLAGDDKEAIQEVCSARGNLVLQQDYLFVSEYLQPWTMEVEYDESVLIWHLATDICYWTASDNQKMEKYCKLSKELSDYMSYLLLRQQALVPQLVGRLNARFKDTTADIRARRPVQNRNDGLTTENLSVQLCKNVIESEIDEISAFIAKAKDSQSVFHEACRLAKQLTMFGEKKWEIMCKVWVEMMCYAAINSSPRPQFAQLSNGGELITFVWLLSIHLGLREPVQPYRGLRATNLTVYR